MTSPTELLRIVQHPYTEFFNLIIKFGMIMRNSLLCHIALASILLLPTQGYTATSEIRAIQSMLSFIGYEPGPVDGVAGRRTIAAIEKFYSDRGQSFDGSIDSNEVETITAEAEAKGYFQYSPISEDSISYDQARLPLFISGYYQGFPSGGNMRFRELYGVEAWSHALVDYDFDGDGIRDKILTVIADADNGIAQQYGQSDRDYGLSGQCEGRCEFSNFTGVVFMKGIGNGEFRWVPNAVVSRDPQDIEYGHSIYVADFNRDGKLDFIATDHGTDQWQKNFSGRPAQYFLSQPNGTWLESSSTHMNGGRPWSNFNHGMTVGDIDSDGDVDIIETTISRNNQSYLWCRINDGSGNMSISRCGGRGTGWGLATGDFDGDGCVDVAQVGTGGQRNHFTGINWGNCSGRFNSGTTRIADYDGRTDDPNNWENTVNVWAHDFDNDGDQDLIVSRVGTYYVGGAMQLVENLGNRQFAERGLLIYNPQPETEEGVRKCHNNTEANRCNQLVDRLYFRDMNGDGIDDIVTAAGASRVNGLVWINNGNFGFRQTTTREFGIPTAMHRRDD